MKSLPWELLFLSKTKIILFKELLQDKQRVMKSSQSLQNTLFKTSREKRVKAGGKAGKNSTPLGNASLYVIWTHRISRHSRHLPSYPIHLIRHRQCLDLYKSLYKYFQCFGKTSRLDSVWRCTPISQTCPNGFQRKIKREHSLKLKPEIHFSALCEDGCI